MAHFQKVGLIPGRLIEIRFGRRVVKCSGTITALADGSLLLKPPPGQRILPLVGLLDHHGAFEIRYWREGPGVSAKMRGPYKHGFHSSTRMASLINGSLLIVPKVRGRLLWVRLPH